MSSVSIIILNYNAMKWLDRCLESLFSTEYPCFSVMLVDNASTDGSVEAVQSRYPSVRVVRNGRNLGFVAGNNVGIKLALAEGADYIVLLNPDTWVEPKWLKEVIAISEANTIIGILGPVQLAYDSNELNSWTTSALSGILDELAEPDAGRPWIPVEWVEGSCFVVKRAVLEKIGVLDPIFSSFYEEIDFCRRARCRGFAVAVVPRSRFHHFRGGSWNVDTKMKRQRDLRCNLGQFIYVMTDPRRPILVNLGWYIITLRSKVAELFRNFSMGSAWDLLKLQAMLFRGARRIWAKWKGDRNSLFKESVF